MMLMYRGYKIELRFDTDLPNHFTGKIYDGSDVTHTVIKESYVGVMSYFDTLIDEREREKAKS